MRRTRRAFISAPLWMILLGAGPGVAQEQPAAQAAAETPPATEEAAMQEVTVTATRRAESVSKVPISISAMTQESLDSRGIKDFADVARFTPGVSLDRSGTNNISIRGISGTGGAGTTGIYLDDTPIQMRALAFSPDEAVPKSFDIERVEVLRGPQGTLFGSGSEGGTVRYITTPPSLSKTSMYSRAEVASTRGGDLSYEAGSAIGGPLVDGKFGARLSLWYRKDAGWIDRINPYTLAVEDGNANHDETYLARLAALWAPTESVSITPSIYYQKRKRNDISTFWPVYSTSNHFVSADPTARSEPDEFYLPALKIEADIGPSVRLISNTSYFHRTNQTGYDGTLYNLGYFQTQNAAPIFLLPWADGVSYPLLDGNGLHVPGGLEYRAFSSIDNAQKNITQEIRLQSTDPAAKLLWTVGVFFNRNRQHYLEQINDPQLSDLTNAVLGVPYTDVFCYLDDDGECTGPALYDPRYPFDSYFLDTQSKDRQYAAFGEFTYGFTEQLKLTVGARYSKMKYSFDTLTGGPQLYSPPRTGTGKISESAFTPKISLQYQRDPNNLFYTTYAKGFRPGGANNPIPFAACPTDFENFGIAGNPETFDSDSVKSYEIGAKNNFDNRVRLASSVYYIKWDNIQQLIVPPVCQISFIANTGKATAKGLDIQAEIAVTPALHLELAAGYTSARYTTAFRFSDTGADPRPLIADGNSIVGASSESGGGQPASPFTASAGLQYDFTALAHDSFLRIDTQYQGRSKWATPSQDAGSSQFDPANRVLAATTFVSLRGGVQLGDWSVAAFVDNLTDSHKLTSLNTTINPLVDDVSRLQRGFTFRPRTIGVTAILRR